VINHAIAVGEIQSTFHISTGFNTTFDRTPCTQSTIVTYTQQGVCHTMALPFTLKSKSLKAKELLWKLKYFTMQKYT
jgi:hypothetical protein